MILKRTSLSHGAVKFRFLQLCHWGHTVLFHFIHKESALAPNTLLVLKRTVFGHECQQQPENLFLWAAGISRRSTLSSHWAVFRDSALYGSLNLWMCQGQSSGLENLDPRPQTGLNTGINLSPTWSDFWRFWLWVCP